MDHTWSENFKGPIGVNPMLTAVPSGEIRVVDPNTGGEKGSKPERYDLIPTFPLMQVARVYGYGAKKYAERNWERGYDWGLSYAAMQRHANAFWRGESYDSESGAHHLASVIFHAMALMEFEERGLGKDTRWLEK